MKLWNYMVMVTLLAILLDLAGINTGMSQILNLIGLHLENIGATCLKEGTCKIWDLSISTFLDSIFPRTGSSITAILAGLIAGGAIVGTFFRLPIENIFGVSFISGVTYIYIKTFSGIVNYTSSYPNWVSFTAITFIVSLGIGYIHSVFDWWTSGGD